MNYLSDTITKPTKTMMESIQHADLGDDVYKTDRTVNHLEGLASNIVGMEDACFMPSGTMANLTAIMAYCPRGSKVVVGDESDIYVYEAGGASVCGGIMYHPIKTQPDGTLRLCDLELAFPTDMTDPQFALPELICLENTHNRCGGKVLPLSYMKEVRDFAKSKNVPVHLDGARIFNATIAMDVDVKEVTKYVDSVQFCLSKGLSAPVGSIVAGTKEFISNVRKLRKMLGGGMRQAGILAAPAIIALETMVNRLKEDHIRAKQLALGLSDITGININPEEVQTNIVMFTLNDQYYTWDKFLSIAKEHNIVFSEMGYGRIRAVIHRHISDKDIQQTIKVIRKMMNYRVYN